MADQRILVVGAGPAGLSAAVTMAKAGQSVLVVDHAPEIGGAVYAQNRTGITRSLTHARERRALFDAVAAQKNRIDIRCSTSFVGVDYKGQALIAGPGGLHLKPKAVIMATGAREVIRPRPGWTCPGVTTAGALQVSLKTSGRPPEGRIAIAGNGPLLYVLGAQLVRVGNAPIAIFDAARPFRHPIDSSRLPMRVLREAAGFVLTLIRARVPIVTGTQVLSVEDDHGALLLKTTHRGRFASLTVDRLGLHDGLARNDYGLHAATPIPIVAAGDCRDVLGRFAAVKDGKRAAIEVLSRLGLARSDHHLPTLKQDEVAQLRLGKLFAHDSSEELRNLPDDTILCRCENRTLADLKALSPAERTPRMLRLNGRFGMGACQGRFCLD